MFLLPDHWRGGAKSALLNPFDYLDSMSGKIGISRRKAIAFNLNREDIYLGSLFFKYDPLESLIYLIHEARHSDGNDPGHVKCVIGSNAQQKGACDQYFRTDKYAGAYAYATSFAFGLAKYGVN